MSFTAELLLEMRRCFENNDWDTLNQKIAYEDALAGCHRELSHFKTVAMFNTDELRRSADFVALLTARLRFNKRHYLQMLVDTLMDMERFDDALPYARELCAMYQNSAGVYQRLAACAEKLGDEKLHKYAVGKYCYCSAVSDIKNLDFAAAANHLWGSVQSGEHDSRGPWLLGKALLFCGEHEKAGEIWQVGLDLLVAEDPIRQDIKHDQLSQAMRLGRFDRAQELIDDLFGLDHNDLEAMRALAIVYERAGQPLSAIRLYHAILELYPFDVPASLKAIHLASMMFEHYQQGLSPIDDESRILVAKVLQHAGYHTAATSMLDSVTGDSPVFRDARLMIIEHFIDSSEFEKALNILQPLMDSQPEDDMYLTMAAQCHCYLGSYTVAEELADRASWINFDNKQAQYWLAESRYWQCNIGTDMTEEQLLEVINSYEDYAYHNPADGLAHERIADVYNILQRYPEVEQNITAARDRGHTSPRASYLLGAYYQSQRNFSAAIKEYDYAIELNGGVGFFAPLIDRAKCYFELGGIERAQSEALKILEDWPGDAEAEELLADCRKRIR